jgi:hypothetical protein
MIQNLEIFWSFSTTVWLTAALLGSQFKVKHFYKLQVKKKIKTPTDLLKTCDEFVLMLNFKH